MRYSIAFFLFCALTVSCGDTHDESTPLTAPEMEDRSFGIILNENAAVRFQPQLHTARIEYLDKGDTVQIIGRSSEQSRIGGITDYWYYVSMPSGLTGWTFGSNLKILKEGDDFTIEDYREQVAQEKIELTLKQLKGKWWSVTKSGNFTSHMLMLYPDKTYRSTRGGLKKEGTFDIDMNDKLIRFSDGTSFGDVLGFSERGQELVLEIEGEEYTYRFKKISSETDKDIEEHLEEYKIEDLEPAADG
ncbi:MAG: SH3 domain-containing protein, partial [Spirochaetota bacterium]